LNKSIFILPAALIAIILLVRLTDLIPSRTEAPVGTAVAFLPDVHFHDIFAGNMTGNQPMVPGLFQDDNLTTPVFLRSMRAQIGSTRLFNENYFAFRAALDDIASRGIPYVVLNGDFSDDGQPIHLDGLQRILESYEQRYSMRFFMSFGNHDPYMPYTQPAGKRDFLMADGQIQGLYSPGHPMCPEDAVRCTEGLQELGYEALFNRLSDYGFVPREGDILFETPFSAPENPDPSDIHNRSYPICTENGSWCGTSFDTSYLIEPEPGIWLLSLDLNIHIPRDNRTDNDPANPANYLSSGNAGFSALIQYKPFLLDWLGQVSERAKRGKKQLFVFSHYPAGDFYHNSRDALAGLFGENGAQLRRLPSRESQQALAETGIPFHVGGHMHLNNTHIIGDREGEHSIGIQSPTLAAYVPGYTIVRYTDEQTITVETIVIEQVPHFDHLFDVYRSEWAAQDEPGWDLTILSSQTYRDFARHHLDQLVRHRFIPNEWPMPLQTHLRESSVQQTAEAGSFSLPLSCDPALPIATLPIYFYRYRSAGSLAHPDIDPDVMQCLMDIRATLTVSPLPGSDDELLNNRAVLQRQLLTGLNLLERFSRPLPDQNFTIDLKTGSIRD